MTASLRATARLLPALAAFAMATASLPGCKTPPPEGVNVIDNEVTRQLKIEPVRMSKSATGTTEATVRFTNLATQKVHVEVRANFQETVRMDGHTGWRHLFLEPGQVQDQSFLSATAGATFVKVDVK